MMIFLQMMIFRRLKMSGLIIETRALTKTFRKIVVVKDINLRVPKRAIYGFLGPNGAGKSTTIRCSWI